VLLVLPALAQEPPPSPDEAPKGPPPRVVPEAWTIPAEILAAVRAVADRSVGARMSAASLPFLGLPYLNGAAGEMDEADPDPVARYDTFDCMTLVEEVLGMALAGDPLYAPMIRDQLRYAGPHDYAHRRHFMEAQWVPAAIEAGLLEDITTRVGHARVLRKEVTPETWKHWKRRPLFHLPDAALPLGTWELPYLDLAEAELAVPRLPPGTLILTLRTERTYVPVATSHVTLVVDTPAGPRMRHATRMGVGKVRDDRLDWYVKHLRNYVKWPVLGLSFLLPRDQGPRLSNLAPSVVPLQALSPAEGPLPTFEAHPELVGEEEL
jgi:hypothetical protein